MGNYDSYVKLLYIVLYFVDNMVYYAYRAICPTNHFFIMSKSLCRSLLIVSFTI